MSVDFHFHLSKGLALTSAELPFGCAISQRVEDNDWYVERTSRTRTACALFIDPDSQDFDRIVRLIESREALAYRHPSPHQAEDTPAMRSIWRASERHGMPAIIHLSRHDRCAFPRKAAQTILSWLVETYPCLQLIVSHCGGENAEVVIEMAARHPGVFLDTSCMHETSARAGYESAPELIAHVHGTVDARKLVYGSDTCWPGSPESSGIDSLRAQFGDQIEKTVSETAAKLLSNINRPVLALVQ
jgi:predicted TIM-barrel fold metal-dependent hydrolase